MARFRKSPVLKACILALLPLLFAAVNITHTSVKS